MSSRPAALAAALVMAGCGAGKGPPQPIQGPAKEAAVVIQALERATARRDFATVCDQLLTASERRQAGGADCARLMTVRAQDVRRPRIRIRSIEVSGGTAIVRVRTSASGQAAADDIVRLAREAGRFRIASLGR